MIIYIYISIIAVIFALIARNEKYDYFFKLAFALLTIVWAIRYGWGNDYFNYLDSFSSLKGEDIFAFSKYRTFRDKDEPIWIFLLLAFRPLGFFGFVTVLSVFENWVICRFIRRNVDRKYYWLALFLYVFNGSFYLIGASMMRQWLAICVVLLASELLEKKKLIFFVILTLLASQIHISAYIALVFIFICFLPEDRLTFKSFIILGSIFIVWSICAGYIFKDVISSFLATGDYDAYSYAYDMEGRSSWSIIGLITSYIFPFVPLFFTNTTSNQNKMVVYLFMLSSFFAPLQNVAELANRFALYPNVFGIAAWPIIMQEHHNNSILKILSFSFVAIIIFLDIRAYLSIYTDPIWMAGFMEYHTIFEVPWQ